MALLCVIKEISYHLPKNAESPNQVEFYVVEFDQLTGTREKYSLEPASDLNLDVPKAILRYWKNIKGKCIIQRNLKRGIESSDSQVETDRISPDATSGESCRADSNLKMDSDDEIGLTPKRPKINVLSLDLNSLLTTTTPSATKSPQLPSLNNSDLLSTDLLSNFLPTSLHVLSSTDLIDTFQREPGYNYQANQYKNKIYAESNYNKDPVTGKFTCGICGKDFVRRHDLFRHEKRHVQKSAEIPGKSGTEFNPIQNPLNNHFICGICGREFVRKHDLYRHEKRHLGVRPYQCSTCGKLFNESGNVKKHIKTAHDGIGDYTVDQRQLDDAKSALLKLTDEPGYLMSELELPTFQEDIGLPTLQENMNLTSHQTEIAENDDSNSSVKREFQ